VFSRHKALKINLIHFDKERKMSKSFKVAALVAVTAMFLAAPVFAPRAYAQSPTSLATAGVFSGEGDDAMDVHWYSGVEFDKGIVFAGNDGTLPSLGYATRFGDLYFSTWYSGNIVSEDSSETQRVVTDYDLVRQLSTGKTTTTTYDSQSVSSKNGIGFLFGVAGMGIKVGFAEDLTTWKNPDRTVSVYEDSDGKSKTYTSEIAEFSQIKGSLVPSIVWGMSIDAGDIVIRPKVSAVFDIHQDSQILNTKGTYDTFNGAPVGDDVTNYTGYQRDYFAPTVGVGLGFELESFTLGIDYGFSTKVYNNSYDVLGRSGDVAGTVSWSNGSTTIAESLDKTTTTTAGTVVFDEITYFNHEITPSFWQEKEVTDGLTLGFSVSVPIGIELTTNESSWNYQSIKKEEYKFDKFRNNTTVNESFGLANRITSTSAFSLEASFSIGAKYDVVPDRFTVKAGAGFTPVSFTSTATTYSNGSASAQGHKDTIYDADGKVVSETFDVQQNQNPWASTNSNTVEDSVKVETEWNGFSAWAGGGFTFSFTNSLSVDAAFFGDSSGGGGVQVLFSLKY
jgi:hypothetical protein